jgi:CelD/BcsL family acetyltransferase involved in cellulose biosynthesis
MTQSPLIGSVEVVEHVDLPLSVVDAWRALAESRENLFVSPEWCAAWAAARPDERPLILVWREKDVLRGVLPLVQTKRGPLRILRFPGARRGDWFSPACRVEDEPRMGVACTKALLHLRSCWHVVALDRLDRDTAWPAALIPDGARSRLATRTARFAVLPYVRFGAGGWSEYLAGRSRNLRSQLGRRRRRLERKHALAFRLTRRLDELEEDMAWLRRLHDRRWEAKRGSSLTPDAWDAHGRFAHTALERGWLRLWNVEADGRRAASWYGWRVGDRYCYSVSGFDPGYADRTLGLVVLAHTMEQAAAEGAKVYDLMWGDEPYKRRFETGRRHAASYTVVRRRHPASGLAASAVWTTSQAGRVKTRLVRPARELFRALVWR